jgi:hypothetical protein
MRTSRRSDNMATRSHQGDWGQVAEGSDIGSTAAQGVRLTVTFIPLLIGNYPVYYDLRYRLLSSDPCADGGQVHEAMGQVALVQAK